MPTGREVNDYGSERETTNKGGDLNGMCDQEERPVGSRLL